MAMRRFLILNRIDVLFAPSYWPLASLVAALAAKSVGTRLVFMTDSHHASGRNEGLLFAIKGSLLKLYDSALVAGSMQKSFVRQLGMAPERIFDGYDAVDNDHFTRIANQTRLDEDKLRDRLDLPQRYFLSLGRFVAKKNLENVLVAFALLVRKNAHAGHDLVFVGSGPMRPKLMAAAVRNKLPVFDHETPSNGSGVSGGGGVHFYPFAQVDTVPVYYALATSFILASTTEEWGLVVNEAMACGCPAIVSREVGSSFDLVIPGVTGYRFSPDNTAELSWFMEKMCSEPEATRIMGRNALTHIGAWSTERFARNALKAARVALGVSIPDDSAVVEEASALTCWFLQTCFPDYRVQVFSRLAERLGPSFHLFSGTGYFSPDVKTTTDHLEWHSLVENRFFLGKNCLWQRGACEAMFKADVVVIELNPRVLSNWFILGGRALWNAPTLVWGHAWGRENSRSIRNVFRLYMMRLATATITYTRTQRDEVRKLFPSLKVFAAPNSLIRARDCEPRFYEADALTRILYVGRLNAAKKPRLLLEGFRRARLPAQVILTLVGEGSERAALEALVDEFGLRERVQLLGHVTDHEILGSIYARSICSVSAGYVGLGAIQSFCFGVPLVLADAEPHAPEVEACREGENTVFFLANDAQSLADTLEKMWDGRAKWLAGRSRLAAWTAEHYSVETMADGFLEALDALRPASAARAG
jgi:glycosyltransferase involved in cell wall biosynthesis